MIAAVTLLLLSSSGVFSFSTCLDIFFLFQKQTLHRNELKQTFKLSVPHVDPDPHSPACQKQVFSLGIYVFSARIVHDRVVYEGVEKDASQNVDVELLHEGSCSPHKVSANSPCEMQQTGFG